MEKMVDVVLLGIRLMIVDFYQPGTWIRGFFFVWQTATLCNVRGLYSRMHEDKAPGLPTVAFLEAALFSCVSSTLVQLMERVSEHEDVGGWINTALLISIVIGQAGNLSFLQQCTEVTFDRCFAFRLVRNWYSEMESTRSVSLSIRRGVVDVSLLTTFYIFSFSRWNPSIKGDAIVFAWTG